MRTAYGGECDGQEAFLLCTADRAGAGRAGQGAARAVRKMASVKLLIGAGHFLF